MLRLLRKPAAAAAAARSLSKAAAPVRPAVAPKKVQVVRWRRKVSITRPLIWGATIYLCWQFYIAAIIDPFLDTLDAEIDALSDEEKKELDEESSEGLFVPFPFTTRRVDQLPYRGRDPEWQMFIQIHKDKELEQKIRDNLIHVVKAVAEKNPLLTSKAGAKTFTVRRWWLDIDFPQRPAPTFEQAGIRFDDKGMSLARQEIDAQSVSRIKQIIWPNAMAQASYTFAKSVVWQQFCDFRTAIGFRPAADRSLPPATLETSQVRLQSGAGGQGRALPPAPNRQTAEATTADRSMASPDKASHETSDKSSGGSGTYPPGASADVTRDPDSIEIPFPETIRRSVKDSLPEFWKKYVQTWRPAMGYPPRGSIMLSGLVELEGPRAVVLIDVVGAFWDPATKQFDGKSMVLSLRSLQFKEHGPLRK